MFEDSYFNRNKQFHKVIHHSQRTLQEEEVSLTVTIFPVRRSTITEDQELPENSELLRNMHCKMRRPRALVYFLFLLVVVWNFVCNTVSIRQNYYDYSAFQGNMTQSPGCQTTAQLEKGSPLLQENTLNAEVEFLTDLQDKGTCQCKSGTQGFFCYSHACIQ